MVKLRATIIIGALALSGCGFWDKEKDKGGTTTDGTVKPMPGDPLSLNAAIPPGLIRNHVEDPELAQYALDQYCGSIVIKTKEGYFTPLGITVVQPKLSAPTEQKLAYHSLFDQGGAASLSAAWGVVGTSFSVSGQNRLEVSLKTLSFCKADLASKAALDEARARVVDLSYELGDAYYITQASLSEMTVDTLTAITSSANAAVTPIVNFGGSNYSKQSDTKTRHFVSLNPVHLGAASAQPPGTVLAAPPASNSLPVQPKPPGQNQPATGLVGKMPSTELLTPEAFATALKASAASPSLKIK